MKSILNSSKFKVWPHGHPWNVPSCLQRIQKKTLTLVTMIFRQHALWQINTVLYILSRIRLYDKLYPQEKLDRKRESMVLEKGTWKRRKKERNRKFTFSYKSSSRWSMNADTTNYHESFKFWLGETLQIMNFNNKACRDGRVLCHGKCIYRSYKGCKLFNQVCERGNICQ